MRASIPASSTGFSIFSYRKERLRDWGVSKKARAEAGSE